MPNRARHLVLPLTLETLQTSSKIVSLSSRVHELPLNIATTSHHFRLRRVLLPQSNLQPSSTRLIQMLN